MCNEIEKSEEQMRTTGIKKLNSMRLLYFIEPCHTCLVLQTELMIFWMQSHLMLDADALNTIIFLRL